MELDKVIKERRTVRKYIEKDISWLAVAEILDYGHLAPSAGNLQDWFFIVVRNKDVKAKVVKACDEADWALKCPVLIVVCADIERAKRMFGERGEKLYSIQDCACAAMQMMLKAHDLGISTAWIGSFDETQLSRAIELEKHAKPLTVLALGYADPKHQAEPKKRKDMNTMIFFDKFGEKERKSDFAMLPLEVPLKRNIDPMKQKLKTAFEDVSEHHQYKVKEFLGKFVKKKN